MCYNGKSKIDIYVKDKWKKGGNNQNTQKPKQCLLRSSDVIMIR